MPRMAAIALILTLAGCGKGSAFDEGFKRSFRTSFVEKCVAGAHSTAAAGSTVDFPRICGCTADKVMADASASDLANISDARMKTAAGQCVAEIYPHGVATAGR